MRLPQVRFTLQEIMVVVAVVALAAAKFCRGYPYPETGLQSVVTTLVGVAFGLGAMRSPLVLLTILLVVWMVTPSFDHPDFRVFRVLAAGCAFGWMIGASMGSISRHARSTHVDFEPSETKRIEVS